MHTASPRTRPSTMLDDEWPVGWFTPGESAFYQTEARKVRGGLVVEVGVYLGRSLSRIAAICRENKSRLVAVDNWRGCVEINEHVKGVQLLEPFRQNMDWLGLSDAVETLSGDSALAASHFAEGSIDLVFIDATHAYEAVLLDAEAWWPRLKWGGVLLGHDYRGEFPGLMKAVDEMFGKPDATGESVWKVVKSAPNRMRGR